MGSELCSEILDGSYFVHVRVNNTGQTNDHYNYWEDEEADGRSKPWIGILPYWLVVKLGPDLGSVGP